MKNLTSTYFYVIGNVSDEIRTYLRIYKSKISNETKVSTTDSLIESTKFASIWTARKALVKYNIINNPEIFLVGIINKVGDQIEIK